MKIAFTDRRQILDSEDREVIERRMAFALSRFAAELKRVEVVFDDENGPRGGVDKDVRLTAWLRSGVKLNVSHQDSSPTSAATFAAARLSRLVARALQRTRYQRPGPAHT